MIKNLMKKTIKKIFFLIVFLIDKSPILFRFRQSINWKKQNKTLKLYKLIEHKETNNKSKIEVVNLNANDICNSKCVMCNIWEQKKDFEISSNQIGEILKNELFHNVKHIGVTGGEPTLRDDLPEIFEQIILSIPNITGLSIITNCIKEKEVIEKINKIIEICNSYKKQFSIMVSLDGFKETHDKIRGRKNNFNSAINVIDYYVKKGIEVTTGSTISKDNVWEMDELLDYIIANKLNGRFRVAEFINRLYNENKTSIIRNFSKDEEYNLILFFYKLIFKYENDESFKRTYLSIINLLSGGERLIGCPYHKNGVVLNSKGELAYCAPKSKIIGSTLITDAEKIYFKNLDELDRIKNNDCKNCIHDYHSSITSNEYSIKINEEYWRNRININSILTKKEINSIGYNKQFDFQIFITGWYGTETVGDKAILGGIIEEIKKKYNEKKIGFVVSSLYPIITKRTIEELNLINCIVIPVYDKLFISTVKGSDLVVMGGGPLMDLDELSLPLTSFRVANEFKIKTIIYGCGLGPLFKKKYINAVKEILNLSDEIYLRDIKSKDIANKWLIHKKDIKLSGDPAKTYINKYNNVTNQNNSLNRITCFLRELTYEYFSDISLKEFNELKFELEYKLAEYIKNKAKEFNVKEIYFDHMHNFVIGNDDRDFSRYFIKKYFSECNITINYNKKLSTIESVVNCMKNSRFNVCMRFHSVVFAHTLNTNFIGLDYTNGGKIKSYLKDNNSIENLLTIEKILKK